MRQIPMYKYLGDNGTITSQIYLEGIYCIKQFQLIADENKLLTKDYITGVKQQLVSERELNQWHEVDASQVKNKFIIPSLEVNGQE